MPWKKGQSGNPSGGTRQVAQARRILEVKSPALMRKAIDEALGGDKDILKFLLGRVLPQPVESNINVKHEHTGADLSGIDEWLVRIAERRGEAARKDAGEEEPAVSPDRHLRAH
jgi:hypothetical protein